MSITDIDTWSVRNWIIRGLVMSCLADEALYDWYRLRVPEPVTFSQFLEEMESAATDGLIYVQRQVPSYLDRGRVVGWALTEAGMKQDPVLR